MRQTKYTLRFEKTGPRDWIAWVRRGAYLLTEEASGTWRVAFMPQMSAKHPKPVFERIGPSLETQRDALVAAQAHEDARRSKR